MNFLQSGREQLLSCRGFFFPSLGIVILHPSSKSPVIACYIEPMKILLALILSHTLVAPSFAFDFPKMKSFLGSLKGLEFLPVYDLKAELERPVLTDEEVPLWIQELSTSIQKDIFGTTLIALSFCDFDGSPMVAEYSNRRVCISKEDFEALPESVVPFVLAHEIGHFVHEMSTHVIPPFDRSLNGSVSAYRFSFEDFAFKKHGHVDWSRLQDDIPVMTKEVLGITSQMHAEVDVYAYLILTGMEIPVPVDGIITLFRSLLSGEASDIDLLARIHALEQLHL